MQISQAIESGNMGQLIDSMVSEQICYNAIVAAFRAANPGVTQKRGCEVLNTVRHGTLQVDTDY